MSQDHCFFSFLFLSIQHQQYAQPSDYELTQSPLSMELRYPKLKENANNKSLRNITRFHFSKIFKIYFTCPNI